MLDEYKRRRIEERTKAICETFSKEYIRAYKDALIAKIKKEYNQKPKVAKQLLTPPVRTVTGRALVYGWGCGWQGAEGDPVRDGLWSVHLGGTLAPGRRY